MSVRRFILRPEDVTPAGLTLRAAEAHHARRVLRLAPGDRVVCFDGCGRSWEGRIVAFGRDSALVEPERELPTEPPPRPRVTLAQGLVKGDKMDVIVQKATELDVARILPLVTDHSDVRLDPQRSRRRAERWERIVVESAKQCERCVLPTIASPISVARAVEELQDETRIAFVERDGDPARSALRELAPSDHIAVFIGPEGGWSAPERRAFREQGVACVSLGRRILRAETAAVVALALVAYEFGGETAGGCAETAADL